MFLFGHTHTLTCTNTHTYKIPLPYISVYKSFVRVSACRTVCICVRVYHVVVFLAFVCVYVCVFFRRPFGSVQHINQYFKESIHLEASSMDPASGSLSNYTALRQPSFLFFKNSKDKKKRKKLNASFSRKLNVPVSILITLHAQYKKKKLVPFSLSFHSFSCLRKFFVCLYLSVGDMLAHVVIEVLDLVKLDWAHGAHVGGPLLAASFRRDAHSGASDSAPRSTRSHRHG